MSKSAIDAINWAYIPEAQAYITAWADRNFPTRTAHAALSKLVLEEIPELLQEIRNQKGSSDTRKLGMEFADTLILLFDLASLWGLDIPGSLKDKMLVNEQRAWKVDPVSGIAQHSVVTQVADQSRAELMRGKGI